MDLFVWPGVKGLDSFDTDCLVVLTYLRLGKCRINLNTCREYNNETIENTPFLAHGNNEIAGVSNIIEYLRKENYGLEYDLSEEERTRLDSLIASVERRIAPACRWFLWADPNVYGYYTSPLYRAHLSFLQGLWYPRRWRDQFIESAKFSQLVLSTDRVNSRNQNKGVESTLYEGARRCLTALSYILGKNQYFLGDRPSAIDAYIFGRLWPLLNYDRMCRSTITGKTPHRLVSYVYQNENLINLCRNIQRTCFPAAASTFRSSLNERAEGEENLGTSRWWFPTYFPGMNTNIPSILPACLLPYRDVIIFGSLSLALFGTFAVASGYIGFEEEEGQGYDDVGEGNGGDDDYVE
ncbi:unnamed protein product [Rodentolepis nana]|uniref:Metaxin n=1 Tax=Rodentolepis nana TaxID=102285 RepID=A0A0R3T4P4_RODNA|nr:unnamed protein product [Rodentolepis nana]